MRDFIWKIRQFGLKIALDDLFISLLMKWLNAKQIKIIYRKNKVNEVDGMIKPNK